MSLTNKIDFAIIFSVDRANPNGDPLNGNRPRTDYHNYGEVSDVCLKRKIRNRMMDLGQNVFVQSDDRCNDGFKSLKDRADGCPAVKKAEKDKDAYAKAACETWLDVRSFGQVFAFKGKESKGDGVSVGVRGPVSIHPAFPRSPTRNGARPPHGRCTSTTCTNGSVVWRSLSLIKNNRLKRIQV